MYLLFFLVVVTLALWYFVVLCIRCIVAVLTKVYTLAFKKTNKNCQEFGKGYVLGLVFVYILTCACHLSCLLLNLVSVFSEIWGKIKYIRICTCFLSILAEVVPQPSKNWFHCIAFMVNLAWFCDVLLCFWSGEDAVSPLIVVL